MKRLLLALLLFTTTVLADFSVQLGTPTQRIDNTSLGLSEIKGFNMYCGTVVGDYQNKTFFPGATLPNTEILVTNLASGTHYCVFTTVDIDARESDYSLNYVTLINNGKARPKPPTVLAGLVLEAVTTIEEF